MDKKIYRQGDIMLIQHDSIPETAEKQDNKGRIVLAWGEATGHAHAISTKKASAYEWQGNTLVKVGKKGAELVHEEHHTIPLPANRAYILRRQKEYSPAEIRTVAD